MQQRLVRLIVIACCSLFLRADAQHTVGYLPLYNFRQPALGRLPLANLTHLNLAFIRADSAGNISMPAWADSVVALAHASGVKVLGSFGGGNPPAYYAQLLSGDSATTLAAAIAGFAYLHRLDGIDVDLEGSMISDRYPTFVSALANLLHRQHKIVSAALATWSASRIPDSTLQRFDFINVMSYDRTGPWTPGKPGPHAPFQMAVEDLGYWILKRGLDRKKIILGLPFYGYRFSRNSITSMSYNEIYAADTSARVKDSIMLADSSTVYFNSEATIRRKTDLAIRRAGGVMIWQLLQDTDNNALLSAIRETMQTFNRRKKFSR
jgi:GH18 family chitinase